jgi:acyl-CoA synthetase (AMP-forming)/AMP-acid ligase II
MVTAKGMRRGDATACPGRSRGACANCLLGAEKGWNRAHCADRGGTVAGFAPRKPTANRHGLPGGLFGLVMVPQHSPHISDFVISSPGQRTPWVLASSGALADPANLLALIQRSRCTHMQATPTMWRSLVEPWVPTSVLQNSALKYEPRPYRDTVLLLQPIERPSILDYRRG